MSGGNETVKARLRELGWVHIGSVVKITGLTRSAIRKWITERKVTSKVFYGDNYIPESALYNHLGEDLAAVYGFRKDLPVQSEAFKGAE